MPHPEFTSGRVRQGLTYSRYLEVMALRAEAPTDGLSPDEMERVEFTRLNLHRSGRIARTWQAPADLVGLVTALPGPQLWMVLTEPWCGDSAQCLPQIATLAGLNPGIELKVILRDDHLDLMDQFLTDGKRSIPILVAFGPDGEVRFRWGPRPAWAQEVFAAAKSEGLEKPAILERLHLFYGRNRGQAFAAEFTVLLGPPAEDC